MDNLCIHLFACDRVGLLVVDPPPELNAHGGSKSKTLRANWLTSNSSHLLTQNTDHCSGLLQLCDHHTCLTGSHGGRNGFSPCKNLTRKERPHETNPSWKHPWPRYWLWDRSSGDYLCQACAIVDILLWTSFLMSPSELIRIVKSYLWDNRCKSQSPSGTMASLWLPITQCTSSTLTQWRSGRFFSSELHADFSWY